MMSDRITRGTCKLCQEELVQLPVAMTGGVRGVAVDEGPELVLVGGAAIHALVKELGQPVAGRFYQLFAYKRHLGTCSQRPPRAAEAMEIKDRDLEGQEEALEQARGLKEGEEVTLYDPRIEEVSERADPRRRNQK